KTDRLLRSCLARDPKQRLHDIADAKLLLADDAAAATVAISGSRRWLWPTVAAILFLALAPVAFVHFREKPALPLPPMEFQIFPPDKNTFDQVVVLSPDGRRLVFTALGPDGRHRLWIRDLDSIEARPLTGTEGAVMPIWSPDGRFIAY